MFPYPMFRFRSNVFEYSFLRFAMLGRLQVAVRWKMRNGFRTTILGPSIYHISVQRHGTLDQPRGPDS